MSFEYKKEDFSDEQSHEILIKSFEILGINDNFLNLTRNQMQEKAVMKYKDDKHKLNQIKIAINIIINMYDYFNLIAQKLNDLDINIYNSEGKETKVTKKLLKKKYHELARKYHPDKGGDPVKMKEVNAAYNFLILFADEKSNTRSPHKSPAKATKVSISRSISQPALPTHAPPPIPAHALPPSPMNPPPSISAHAPAHGPPPEPKLPPPPVSQEIPIAPRKAAPLFLLNGPPKKPPKPVKNPPKKPPKPVKNPPTKPPRKIIPKNRFIPTPYSQRNIIPPKAPSRFTKAKGRAKGMANYIKKRYGSFTVKKAKDRMANNFKKMNAFFTRKNKDVVNNSKAKTPFIGPIEKSPEQLGLPKNPPPPGPIEKSPEQSQSNTWPPPPPGPKNPPPPFWKVPDVILENEPSWAKLSQYEAKKNPTKTNKSNKAKQPEFAYAPENMPVQDSEVKSQRVTPVWDRSPRRLEKTEPKAKDIQKTQKKPKSTSISQSRNHTKTNKNTEEDKKRNKWFRSFGFFKKPKEKHIPVKGNVRYFNQE